MTLRNIEWPEQRIDEFCRRWNIRSLSLFGSVLRDDFRPDSDIDVLFTYDDEASITGFDLVDMEDELSRILGRKVDLVSRRSIEESRNWIRRANILQSAEIVYEAR